MRNISWFALYYDMIWVEVGAFLRGPAAATVDIKGWLEL